MNAHVLDSGRIVPALPLMENPLPRPPAEALMPGAAVLPLENGMARLVDNETGRRLSIFANRELAEQCRDFLGGSQ